MTARGARTRGRGYAMSELLVRVNALLRRNANGDRPTADEPRAAVVLDPGRHAIRHGDREESLTPTEFRILAALTAAGGDVVRRHPLVSSARPDGAIVHDNTLNVCLARIRRKLRRVDAPSRIDTVRGVGYRLR
jgi:two-component system OmpR family response regulator